MTDVSPQTTAESLEKDARAKFNSNAYTSQRVMSVGPENTQEYFVQLDLLKRQFLRRYIADKQVLDLCCATCRHLLEIAPETASSTGLDFSHHYLVFGREEARQRNDSRTRFLCGNARQLPFANGAFGVVYSFSALCYIPRQDEVLKEIGRILEPGGMALLELGNKFSLNTLVGRAHTETVAMCNLSLSEMRRMLSEAGLEVVEHHALQILPFWGNKPKWLRPLLSPFWKNLFAKRVAGKMLDQWICALPGFKQVAFRQFFICRKK